MSIMKMLENTSEDNVQMSVTYDTATHLYTVAVKFENKDKSETFPSNFEPRFGMDVVDMNEAYTIAERLANELVG